ncbi:TerC family protein [Cohnella candidum]|uniref:TerC family protein n=1 Tax=Cohnella candidum TaxID=2674991 RepID=A0A3G3K3U6_9BACL|nr:TerC family protein [Cohnella candidum]AYQ75112.1 TerC family protein [Cohnella candidum]
MEGDWLLGLLKIMLVNIVLSGDNAVVIAMACRRLAPAQQKRAVFWGTMGAVLLRLVLTGAAVWLLKVPLVEACGGILLFYIAVKLLTGQEEEEENGGAGLSIRQAVRTIIVADVVMSLDNVVAVAGVANGNWLLIGIGLAISIPLIIFCSSLLMRLMTKYLFIVWLGAGLLGYTAGEMLVKDEWVHGLLQPVLIDGVPIVPAVLTLAVVGCGAIMAKRASSRSMQERG